MTSTSPAFVVDFYCCLCDKVDYSSTVLYGLCS